MANDTVIREHGEGQAYWMLGGLYEVKVAGSETGGAMTVMELTLPPGSGPPPHTHDGDEVLYLLEGKIRHHIADRSVDVATGAIFHIPRGTWEWFEPLEKSRVLITYTPGGIDQFFREAGEPATSREVPPPSQTPPDLERLAAIGARYGMQMRPPS